MAEAPVSACQTGEQRWLSPGKASGRSGPPAIRGLQDLSLSRGVDVAVVTQFRWRIQDGRLHSREGTLLLLCPPRYGARGKRLHFPDRSEGDDGGSAQHGGGLWTMAGLSKADVTAGRGCLQGLRLGGAAVEVQHGSLRRASAVGY